MQPYEQNQTAYGTGFARTAAQVDQGLRAFMLGVYNNMVLGLAISALVALGINMLATTSDPSAGRRPHRRREPDPVRRDACTARR